MMMMVVMIMIATTSTPAGTPAAIAGMLIVVSTV